MGCTYSPFEMFAQVCKFAARYGYSEDLVTSARFNNRCVAIELQNDHGIYLNFLGVPGGGFTWQMMVQRNDVTILLEKRDTLDELFVLLNAHS